MENSTITLITILLLLIYTLYYTFTNDYGLFLFIILLMLVGFYLNEKIDEKISNVLNRIGTIKNNITSELNWLI